MLPEFKEKLDQQYDDMYKTDWVEIIGTVIVGTLIFVFAYLYFKYVSFN